MPAEQAEAGAETIDAFKATGPGQLRLGWVGLGFSTTSDDRNRGMILENWRDRANLGWRDLANEGWRNLANEA